MVGPTHERHAGPHSANLPEYAQPLFLRIKKELDVTGTFKQRKMDLVKEGFDPSRITDDLYFND